MDSLKTRQYSVIVICLFYLFKQYTIFINQSVSYFSRDPSFDFQLCHGFFYIGEFFHGIFRHFIFLCLCFFPVFLRRRLLPKAGHRPGEARQLCPCSYIWSIVLHTLWKVFKSILQVKFYIEQKEVCFRYFIFYLKQYLLINTLTNEFCIHITFLKGSTRMRLQQLYLVK